MTTTIGELKKELDQFDDDTPVVSCFEIESGRSWSYSEDENPTVREKDGRVEIHGSGDELRFE